MQRFLFEKDKYEQLYNEHVYLCGEFPMLPPKGDKLEDFLRKVLL
jgi:hypothetical protein